MFSVHVTCRLRRILAKLGETMEQEGFTFQPYINIRFLCRSYVLLISYYLIVNSVVKSTEFRYLLCLLSWCYLIWRNEGDQLATKIMFKVRVESLLWGESNGGARQAPLAGFLSWQKLTLNRKPGEPNKGSDTLWAVNSLAERRPQHYPSTSPF